MIDLARVLLLHGKMEGRVRYRLGAKARPTMQTGEIDELDCSGYMQYLMRRSGAPDFPDGSWLQSRYAMSHGWHKLAQYRDVTYAAKDPKRLFLAFFPERQDNLGRRRYGHIWLVYMGKTIECCGSGGVTRRQWNQRTLLARVETCWEVPCRLS